MAAGSPFTMVPNVVTRIEPVYNNVESETESQKKEYFNIAGSPVEQFRLEFGGKTKAELQAFMAHFNDQLGSFYAFSWQSVPDYIDGGADMTGRWVAGSYKETPVEEHWKFQITFEKAN
ncbi:MAG TPA: hypothetical protein DHV36_16135 [Desulfobacteraceae bacterium]|nr:hypothetical protein [Desulfobacteraceae bacterium]|tara:strand:+ start:1094 stop:1450 length:357 start_codon:yes stop_codon:yes gene_type:complete